MTILSQGEAATVIAPLPARPLSFKPESIGIMLGFGEALIWGAYLAMARAGVSAGLNGFDIAFFRFSVAGAISLPWLVMHSPQTLGGVGWKRASILALLAGPLFILIGVGGYAFAPLAHGAVIQPAVLTIGAMVAASILFGDRLTVARIVGISTIIFGLGVVAGPGLFKASLTTPIGDAMFAIAGLMWAGFTILGKRWGIGPMAATAAVSVLSAVVIVPGYLATGGIAKLIALPTSVVLGQIIVQGVLSGVVGVLAFTRAVQLLGAGRAAIFPALVPATAIILGIPIAGEMPTMLQLTGLVVVTAGLLVAMGLIRLPVFAR